MTQRGVFDVIEALYIEESTRGTTPTTGTWKPYGLPTLVDPRRAATKIRRRGIGTQKPTAFQTVKEHWTARLEYDLLTKETSPAYNWKDFLNMALNIDGSGNPQNQPKMFSLGAKVDLSTDEFYWLKGGSIENFEISGRDLEGTVKAAVDAVFQSGDYGITDYVSGSATRQAMPTTAAKQIAFGDIDIWYDTTTPDDADSIIHRINSWSFNFRRRLEKRGTMAGAATKWRDFVCVEQNLELELNLDFDSRTEYEHFIDDTGFYCTLNIPEASGGVKLALSGGSWVGGELPVRELDLMGVTLRGEFTQLTVTDIA